MKKTICCLLAAVLVFMLCACGSASPVPVPGGNSTETEVVEVEKIPEKYAGLIASIEAGDYDGAVAIIDAMRPAPVIPDIMEVTITTKNFFDYFEYKEYVDDSLTMRDEAGNITNLFVIYSYVLKDEYTVAEVKADDCVVAADITYEYITYGYPEDLDFVNRTFTASGDGTEISETLDITLQGKLVDHGTVIEGLGAEEQVYEVTLPAFMFSNYAVQQLKSVDLVSAGGTLYLYKNP